MRRAGGGLGLRRRGAGEGAHCACSAGPVAGGARPWRPQGACAGRQRAPAAHARGAAGTEGEEAVGQRACAKAFV